MSESSMPALLSEIITRSRLPTRLTSVVPVYSATAATNALATASCASTMPTSAPFAPL